MNGFAADASTVPGQPPGIDLARLGEWLAGSGLADSGLADSGLGGGGGPLSARLLPGGKSNLTYAVSDGARRWVLRRPPLGHVLATAHDMGREFRVISALAGTAVPVPAAYALCADESILGAPFYLMEFVDATAYRYAADLAPLGAVRVRAISAALVDTLSALHEVDPAAVGLAGFGRPEGFLARQVSRWKRQLDASYCRDLSGAEELHARLAAGVPPASKPGIVHGDYRLDNVLINAADRLVAVIDWEMSTLGDPLTDLALLIVYQRLSRITGGSAVLGDYSLADGFLTADEITGRYAARSRRDLTHFGFYLGLAAFKLAAVVEGIHYRHLHGQTVGEGFERVGALTEPLLAAGLNFLEKER